MARNLTLLSKTVSRGVDNILVGPLRRIVAGVKGEGKGEEWECPRKENVLYRKDSVNRLKVK